VNWIELAEVGFRVSSIESLILMPVSLSVFLAELFLEKENYFSTYSLILICVPVCTLRCDDRVAAVSGMGLLID
jgi:hypothetical protein